jgi:hypothetical protein
MKLSATDAAVVYYTLQLCSRKNLFLPCLLPPCIVSTQLIPSYPTNSLSEYWDRSNSGRIENDTLRVSDELNWEGLRIVERSRTKLLPVKQPKLPLGCIWSLDQVILSGGIRATSYFAAPSSQLVLLLEHKAPRGVVGPISPEVPSRMAFQESCQMVRLEQNLVRVSHLVIVHQVSVTHHFLSALVAAVSCWFGMEPTTPSKYAQIRRSAVSFLLLKNPL